MDLLNKKQLLFLILLNRVNMVPILTSRIRHGLDAQRAHVGTGLAEKYTAESSVQTMNGFLWDKSLTFAVQTMNGLLWDKLLTVSSFSYLQVGKRCLSYRILLLFF